MAKVIVQASMSLDGFIADEDDGIGSMFDWMGSGDVEYVGSDPKYPLKVSRASADYLGSLWPTLRCEVVGRRTFNLTNGWNGIQPAGDHVFVVTHTAPTDWPFPDAPFTFVTDGIDSAIRQAKAYAGEGNVGMSAGSLTGQALALGLVDEVCIDLTPVLMRSGVRFFSDHKAGMTTLGDPQVVVGKGVTHLRYPILQAITDRYGEGTTNVVAMQLEYRRSDARR